MNKMKKFVAQVTERMRQMPDEEARERAISFICDLGAIDVCDDCFYRENVFLNKIADMIVEDGEMKPKELFSIDYIRSRITRKA